MAKRKNKKPTKTAQEFNRIKKRIREQERYYNKKGFDLPSVSDTFYQTKPTRKTLSEIKKYEKLFKSNIADIKQQAVMIKKEKGVSVNVAYRYLSARDRESSGDDILKFEDVLMKSFIDKVNQFPNYQSRVQMGAFIVRMGSLLGTTETARILAETAENETDFEAILQYRTDDVALYNTYNLMETIVNSIDESENPLTVEELRDFMDTLEF